MSHHPLGNRPMPLAAAFAAFAALALWWVPGAAAAPDVRLYVFDCGRIEARDLSRWTPGENEGVHKRFSVTCFVVRHPEGTLLWDTGLNDGLAERPGGMTVADGLIHVEVPEPFVPKLERIGLAPADIDYVAFSHMHPDHSGNGNAFTGATVLMQAEEHAAAFGENPGRFHFNPAFYGDLADSPTRKLDGDFDVFGDGSVVIQRTTGHTPGHQSLLVRLPEAGPVLISGDLWHFRSNRMHQRVPLLNHDEQATRRAMKRMEALVRRTRARVWIQHDRAQMAMIPKAPYAFR